MPAIVYRNAAGVQVPGVTTVLGEWGAKTRGLVHAAWKLGTEGRDYKAEWGKKADAGSLTHARCEANIRGIPSPPTLDYPPEVVKDSDASFAAYLDWKSSTTLELVASEVALVSERWGFGGCLDGVGALGGHGALIDFKKKTLYPEQIVQAAAYRMLWNEHHPESPLETVHILGLSEGFHHHQPPESALKAGWEVFLRLLDIYRLKKEVRAK